MSLTTHHLEFTARAVTPLALDGQTGTAIRGALVGALWGQFCTNKAAPTCAGCSLVSVCPVAALVAPMREDASQGGDQRPRPYVVQPPIGAERYAAGETFSFGLTLIGSAVPLFPYLVMAAQGIEASGLGRRLAENDGRRGALRLARITARNPLTGERQVLYERDRPQVQAPGLPVTAADIAAYAAALPAHRLTLRFLTPLRLIDNGRLVQRFDPRAFTMRLTRRLNDLIAAYGDGPLIDHVPLIELSRRVQVVADQTRWVDIVSFSSRTRQRTPIGGLVGSVTLAGDLVNLRALFVWGSLVHVGRNAVKGDGWYVLEQPPLSAG